jgi:hypothetical protein
LMWFDQCFRRKWREEDALGLGRKRKRVGYLLILVRFIHERSGGAFRAIQEFQTSLEKIYMDGPPAKGYVWTWSNTRKSPLSRVLANEAWRDFWTHKFHLGILLYLIKCPMVVNLSFMLMSIKAKSLWLSRFSEEFMGRGCDGGPKVCLQSLC